MILNKFKYDDVILNLKKHDFRLKSKMQLDMGNGNGIPQSIAAFPQHPKIPLLPPRFDPVIMKA